MSNIFLLYFVLGKMPAPFFVIRGDILQKSEEHQSMLHCISADGAMRVGLAKQVVRKYPQLKELRKMNLRVGSCVVYRIHGKYIYNLVTKKKCTDLPEYSDIKRALQIAKEHAVRNGVIQLLTPQLACGKDKRDWGIIRKMICDIFWDTGILVTLVHQKEDPVEFDTRSPLGLCVRRGPTCFCCEATKTWRK